MVSRADDAQVVWHASLCNHNISSALSVWHPFRSRFISGLVVATGICFALNKDLVKLNCGPVDMSRPSALDIIHAYRSLYRATLHAVQYSKPNRYTARNQLRRAFRKEDPSSFDSQKISRTVEFLNLAAQECGLEHRILKSLLHTRWWYENGQRKLAR
jgi:hypothetical protein